MIEAILFDFDLTLVDSKKVSEKEIQELKELYGLKINLTDREIWTSSHLKLMKKLAEENYERESSSIQISLWNKFAMSKFYFGCKINDIQNLIEIKDKEIYFGIVSNNLKRVIEDVVSKNGNEILKFDEVHANNSFKNYISKIERINDIIEKNNFNRSNVMYVGDSKKDIFYANRAGVISVGVTTGVHSYKSLKKEYPDIIINRLSELSNYLDYSF